MNKEELIDELHLFEDGEIQISVCIGDEEIVLSIDEEISTDEEGNIILSAFNASSEANLDYAMSILAKAESIQEFRRLQTLFNISGLKDSDYELLCNNN